MKEETGLIITVSMPEIKAQMCFKLKDGSELLICKEDCQTIANAILMEGLLRGGVKMINERDSNLKKAEYLLSIVNGKQELEPDMKKDYLQQILYLTVTPGETIEETVVDNSNKKR